MIIKFKKTFLIIISVIGLLLASLGIMPSNVKADELELKQVNAGELSSAMEVIGQDQYLNAEDIGFNVSFQIKDEIAPSSVGLFIDNSPLPISEVSSPTEGELNLSSETVSSTELQTLISEGSHQVQLKTKMEVGGDYTPVWSANFLCDYHSPHGWFKATAGKIKTSQIIGDAVNLEFTPNFHSQDTVSVKGSLYDRELIWKRIEDSAGKVHFESKYVIAAGDPSMVTQLLIENIEITDLAGNVTKIPTKMVDIDFVIDTSVPSLRITPGGFGQSINQGDEVILEGISEPGAQIILTIHSTPLTVKTIADLAGNWRLQIDTSKLELGLHSAILTAINSVGNKTILNLGNFKVIEAPKEEASTPETVEVAQAESSEIKSDVKPVVYQRPQQTSSIEQSTVTANEPVDVAKQGRISSSQDAKNSAINWSAWILALSMVVLASALATAGYYGYGWVVLKQGNRTQIEKIEPREGKNLNSGSEIIASEEKDLKDHTSDEKEEPPKTRW